jgi:uroporphyrinogen decarboxylase
MKVCRTPELACEVTLQPIRRYKGLLDASIIFSDILVISEALGLPFEVRSGYGIHFPDKLDSPEEIDTKLHKNINVEEKLDYVLKAITLTRKELKGEVPLFGFSGSPWTLMSYMVEGKSGTNHSTAKSWLYKYPEASHKLLNILSDTIIDYMVAQVKAGAQLLQLFDSWAGELSPEDFNTFSYPYILKIGKGVSEKIKELNYDVPISLFAKGAHYALNQFKDQSYFSIISLDWTIDPKVAREAIGDNIALQGNLDPTILFAPADTLKKRTTEMLHSFGTKPYIANLGHGMLPNHDPEHLKVFLETIKEVSTEILKN